MLDFVVRNIGSSILCLESALELHMLTSKVVYRTKVYNSSVELDLNHLETFENYSDSYITEKDGILITTEERTIVDMIRFDRSDDLIFEALEEYYYRYNNFTKLEKVAKDLRMIGQLEYYLDELNNQ